ncbi:hypothetical protein ES703_69853 [subsurface metagenome]
MITKREIYPWWNSLTKNEKMEIYFKYFTSGTHEDCIEWWYGLDIAEKIKVFNKELGVK